MKILVDADACPVKSIIVEVAKKFKLPVIMFTDTSHILNDDYSKMVTVDKGRDSVDIALINRTIRFDIVVTQDYGVAAMALSRDAFCIHPNGIIYDKSNIDNLLFERHISQKIRRAGGKTFGPKKRTKENNEKFYRSFYSLCLRAVNKK